MNKFLISLGTAVLLTASPTFAAAPNHMTDIQNFVSRSTLLRGAGSFAESFRRGYDLLEYFFR